eukprot:EG_transcript_25535
MAAVAERATPGDTIVVGFEVPVRRPILLTGFGPFRKVTDNPSTTVARLLHHEVIEGALVQCEELEVSYRYVTDVVPQLWQHLSPGLVVHLGLSAKAKAVTLEQCCRNTGYDKPDVLEVLPDSPCCVEGGPECLYTSLDLPAIAEAVTVEAGLPCELSSDPGLYLCEYVLYTSMHLAWRGQLPVPVLFVHIPEAVAPFTVEALAAAVRTVLRTAMRQESARTLPRPGPHPALAVLAAPGGP